MFQALSAGRGQRHHARRGPRFDLLADRLRHYSRPSTIRIRKALLDAPKKKGGLFSIFFHQPIHPPPIQTPPIHPPTHLSIFSVYPFIYQCIYLSMYLRSIYCIYISIYYLSIYPSVYTYLSIDPSIQSSLVVQLCHTAVSFLVRWRWYDNDGDRSSFHNLPLPTHLPPPPSINSIHPSIHLYARWRQKGGGGSERVSCYGASSTRPVGRQLAPAPARSRPPKCPVPKYLILVAHHSLPLPPSLPPYFPPYIGCM